MRIGFLTVGDPRDKRTWSGTFFYMAEALRRGASEVVSLGPITPLTYYPMRVLGALSRGYAGHVVAYKHSMPLAHAYKRIVEKRLARGDVDVLVAPAASPLIGLVETDVPIVYTSDATFALVHGYHADFTGLSRRSVKNCEALERLSIQKAGLLLYPSEWAARSAIHHYGASPEKVHVMPYGANFDISPAREDVRFERREGPWRLLFVGMHWERKGGDIVLETLEELRSRGVECTLTIVGCTPPRSTSSNGLVVIPSLNKNDPDDARELERLYLDADFLVQPTRIECLGIVFCEAAAYGLPAIATDTGGVSGVVRHGETGMLLPPKLRGDAYADAIEQLTRDPAAYAEMRRAARERFEQELNWDAWARAALPLIERLSK